MVILVVIFLQCFLPPTDGKLGSSIEHIEPRLLLAWSHSVY